jgi:hypothetical protein
MEVHLRLREQGGDPTGVGGAAGPIALREAREGRGNGCGGSEGRGSEGEREKRKVDTQQSGQLEEVVPEGWCQPSL